MAGRCRTRVAKYEYLAITILPVACVKASPPYQAQLPEAVEPFLPPPVFFKRATNNEPKPRTKRTRNDRQANGYDTGIRADSQYVVAPVDTEVCRYVWLLGRTGYGNPIRLYRLVLGLLVTPILFEQTKIHKQATRLLLKGHFLVLGRIWNGVGN